MQSFSIHEVGAAAMLPPRDILVSQWADENRVLTGGAAAERGQWHTRPYQREPMDVLSPGHPCRQVVLWSAAQLLKTEVLLNFIGFIADVDPGPVLVVEPRTEDAKALSKDRVAPMFRATPALRGKIAPVKSRDSNNTTLHKVLANGAGHITFTGAISPSGLAMRPIRYALLDEVDRYPASAGTEGDPVSLAIQRTSEFQHNKKIVMASTPTIKGISRIELAWLESDQRDYFVPCPKCGHFQVLAFGDGTGPGLVWPEGKPVEAMYRCGACQESIPHHQKAWMVERGEYRAQNPSSPTPGFRLSQLISPKKPWGEIAVEFLAAKKSPETLKAFLNTVLAELWEETHETPTDAHALWNRCEPFEAEAPDGVALITAGVDVQADRLELEIVGWGRDEESWSIAYHVNFFGVSVNNQNPGDSSELVVEGVFDLAKDGSAFVSGAKVYWDNTQQLATANTLTAAGAPTKEIGFAVLSQASGVNAPGGLTTDPTVRVRLTPLGITPVGVSDLDPSVLQKAVVTLTAAQIMAMNGAPVSILPAPAAGQVLVIDQIIAQMKPGATQFTGGGAVTFQYHGTAVVPHSGNIPAATITGAAGSENVVPPPTGTIQPPAATGLDITNGTAAFATGNGVLVVTIFYSLVTLS